MTRTRTSFGTGLALAALLAAGSATPALAETCLWEGRAPACNGECRPGYTLASRDKAGDGKKCVTGKAAICRLPIQ